MVSGTEVLGYLSALDYPAGKEDIMREARRADAPREVLRALAALPAVQYRDGAEVARSAGTDVAPEETPASVAAKNRDRRHQRVARHLRGI
jgi:uncharacterized phage protein gp47/JayE